MVLQMRDGDKLQTSGRKARVDINDTISHKLLGMDVREQADIDKFVAETRDGTKNEWGLSKAKPGANATLAILMTVCRTGAAVKLADKRTDQFFDARILSQRD